MAKVKVFGNRQTDTYRQKGTQTDKTTLDSLELHFGGHEKGSSVEGESLRASFDI